MIDQIGFDYRLCVAFEGGKL